MLFQASASSGFGLSAVLAAAMESPYFPAWYDRSETPATASPVRDLKIWAWFTPAPRASVRSTLPISRSRSADRRIRWERPVPGSAQMFDGFASTRDAARARPMQAGSGLSGRGRKKHQKPHSPKDHQPGLAPKAAATMIPNSMMNSGNIPSPAPPPGRSRQPAPGTLNAGSPRRPAASRRGSQDPP